MNLLLRKPRQEVHFRIEKTGFIDC